MILQSARAVAAAAAATNLSSVGAVVRPSPWFVS